MRNKAESRERGRAAEEREPCGAGFHVIPPDEPDAETVVRALRRGDDCATRVLRCAHAVHAELGPGLEDYLYARALALALARERILCERDVFVEVRYAGSLVGKRRLAFLTDTLAVDLASDLPEPPERTDARAESLLRYRPVGLALHFGGARLQASRAEGT